MNVCLYIFYVFVRDPVKIPLTSDPQLTGITQSDPLLPSLQPHLQWKPPAVASFMNSTSSRIPVTTGSSGLSVGSQPLSALTTKPTDGQISQNLCTDPL